MPLGLMRQGIPDWMETVRSTLPMCRRCRKNPSVIMSMFNTDMICLDCKEREKKHPMYPLAKSTEEAETRSGNYNFPGIGLPDDLAKEIAEIGHQRN